MKKILYLVFLFSTLSAQAQNSAQDYINQYKDAAIGIMSEYGIPASVVLAIAMHESANGTSTLAQKLNNHFGVKSPGGSYYHLKNKKVRSAYKKYDDATAAYNDFANLISQRKAFSHLADKLTHYDYKGWARGIHRGGYAHSRIWSSQIMNIIKRYQLYHFDNRPKDYEEPIVEDQPAKQFASNQTTFYSVRKGDTLSLIAKKFRTSVKAIQNKNGLKDSRLKIGQKLKV